MREKHSTQAKTFNFSNKKVCCFFLNNGQNNLKNMLYLPLFALPPLMVDISKKTTLPRTSPTHHEQ